MQKYVTSNILCIICPLANGKMTQRKISKACNSECQTHFSSIKYKSVTLEKKVERLNQVRS